MLREQLGGGGGGGGGGREGGREGGGAPTGKARGPPTGEDTATGEGTALSEYTFVDFCAGAGGPSVGIERIVNEKKSSRDCRGKKRKVREGGRGRSGGDEDEDEDEDAEDEEDKDEDAEDKEEKDEGVDFVLTDLHPHLTAWRAAALKSRNILYVPTSVDAATAPSDLLSRAVGHRRGRQFSTNKSRSNNDDNNRSRSSSPSSPSLPIAISNTDSVLPTRTTPTNLSKKKQFNLFFLALHHFPDPSASTILLHSLRNSSGFGIFELQSRTFESLALMALFGPLMWLGSWWWFWGDWALLWWMYVVPVVPFVVVFDGVVSSLRTRRPGEVRELVVMRERGQKGGGVGVGVGAMAGIGGEREDGDGEIRNRRRKRQAPTTTTTIINGEDEIAIEPAPEPIEENDQPIDFSKWHFSSGTETHTWPLGEMNWFVAVKRE